MRIQQQYPITDGQIKATELQADINQIITTLNTLTHENLNKPGNVFDFGTTKLNNLIDPAGTISDATDLQVAVTKKYLQEKIYDDFLSTGGDLHSHDNKILLDSILRNVQEIVDSTTDGATTDKLEDSVSDFTVLGVTKHMICYNVTTDLYGIVTAVDSANILSVVPDIFGAGDDYKIYPIPSVEILDGDPFNSFTIPPTQKAALDEVHAAKDDFGSGTDRIALMSDVPVYSGGINVTNISEATSFSTKVATSSVLFTIEVPNDAVCNFYATIYTFVVASPGTNDSDSGTLVMYKDGVDIPTIGDGVTIAMAQVSAAIPQDVRLNITRNGNIFTFTAVSLVDTASVVFESQFTLTGNVIGSVV